jgi:signal transduction histidine kinase
MINFRLSLTLWFVLLSSIVYISLSMLGFAAFKASISDSIDEELRILASEIGHAVDLAQEKPHFRDWARTLKTDPGKGLATIQLFDTEGNLLEEFGPKTAHRLHKRFGELKEGDKNYRVSFTPLISDGNTVGYLQFELSAAGRDQSTERLFLISLLLGPCVVIGLGVSSYIVSGLAAKPLQDNLESMRRFIGDAGHELNTPLSIVKAKTESLERKLADNPLVEELSASKRALGRMENVVENLMYLTELDARELKHEQKEMIDLRSLCSQIIDDFEARFVDKNVSLRLLDGDSVQVSAESDSLYRAVSNLVENAWRYTDEGGAVTLSCVKRGEKAEIIVADNGRGIPSESQKKIFERFYRVDRSRSRMSGGVGLGLSIVKAIVEKHGGSVAVESSAGGSSFTLSLPREPALKQKWS